jgi:hypothetical protein
VRKQPLEPARCDLDEPCEVLLGRAIAVAEQQQLRRDRLAVEVTRRRQHQHAGEVAAGHVPERQYVIVGGAFAELAHEGLESGQARGVNRGHECERFLMRHGSSFRLTPGEAGARRRNPLRSEEPRRVSTNIKTEVLEGELQREVE